jgi:rsbT co-antagonist protein RsbR
MDASPTLVIPGQQRLIHLSDDEIQRKMRLVGLGPDDLQKIAFCKDAVLERIDDLTATFFAYLEPLPEAQSLFRRNDVLTDAKRQKRDHLIAMVSGNYGGNYGREYVEQRLRLGALYATVGLDFQAFLGAFYHLMRSIASAVILRAGSDPTVAFENFLSLKKIELLDIGLILQVIVAERERIIGVQQDAIRELSTPVLQVRDRLLVLPIIGVLDSLQAKELTDGLLHAIREKRAKVVVVDITGVAAVDSQVANHLIQTISAAKLMGAQVIVTGLSADVAQSLVALGVDLQALNTAGDLQGGLDEAERIMGCKILRGVESPAVPV